MPIDCGGYAGPEDDNAKAAERIKTAERNKWDEVIRNYDILADGHRLVTCGPHTGHVMRVLALCESDHIARAMAESFAVVRLMSKTFNR